MNSACMYFGSSLPLSILVPILCVNTGLFLFLVISYGCIWKTVHQSAVQTGKQQSVIKLVINLGGIIVTSLLSWLIIAIFSIMAMVGSPLFSSLEVVVGLIVFPLNAFINPLLNRGWVKTFSFKKPQSMQRKPIAE